MDPRDARASLEQVRARQDQVRSEAVRRGSPWWYVTGLAAVFLAISAGIDLEERLSALAGEIVSYGLLVGGLAVITVLALALRRSMGVRPRRGGTGKAGTYPLGMLVAFLVIHIGLGTLLRLYDVPWDSTISGAVGAAVFVGGTLALRRLVSTRPAATS